MTELIRLEWSQLGGRILISVSWCGIGNSRRCIDGEGARITYYDEMKTNGRI